MLNSQVKTSEILLSGNQPGGLVINFVSPVQINTDPSGKTFLFGLVQSANQQFLKIISDTIVFLENPENIAESQKKYSRFSSPQIAVEAQLESILKNINTKINSCFIENDIKSAFRNSNILLALQNENALSLSGRGDICAIILRPRKKQTGINFQETYEVLDLTKQSEENSNNGDDGLFPNFLSGNMNGGDTLIISTKNLWEKISEENLIRGIAALPPQSAIEFLKSKIGRWNNNGAAAFILKLAGNENESLQKESPRARLHFGNFFKNSMDELRNVEKKTENVLSHPNLFKKYGESIGNLLSKMERQEPAKFPPRKIARQINGSITKNLRKFLENLWFASKMATILFLRTSYRLFCVATNFNGARDKAREGIKKDFSDHKNKLFSWFNALPKKSKYLLVSSIFLAFIFTQSIFLFSAQQSHAEEKAAYNAIIQDIKNMTEAAEASMIYGDSKKAENILADAENKISKLSQKTKNEKKQVAYLTQILNEKLKKILAVIEVAEPRLLADLGNADGEHLAQSGKDIYILSPVSASILKLDPETGRVSPFISFENTEATPEQWMQTDTQKILVWKNTETGISTLAEINLKDKKISPLSFNADYALKDFKIYNSKIYALSSSKQQIIKHNGATGGFGKGSDWAKDGQAELANAFAMAMDGAIYALKTNGNIIKYYAGKLTGFYARVPKVIGQEELKLEKAKMWTNDEAKYIYVLDQTNNRILAFDKNGVLKGQYISPVFKDLKDFVINESEHKIFVLSGTQVLGIIASHIESNK